MSDKRRLDTAMVERGLSTGREQAKRSIMSGVVYINGQKAAKASQMVGEQDIVTVKGELHPFVSRGGMKLDRALKVFPINVEGLVCADVGASTGGFTDCMLQHGAKKVYSLDVGYGQLDWKLRSDPRVVVMERTNARYMERSWFADQVEFGCMDVSFISIRLILPPLLKCLKQGSNIVALIKPQFEAGKDKVGKKGVVKDRNVHKEVIMSMLEFASNSGFSVMGLDHSPIKGPEGNEEFLLWLNTEVGIDALNSENYSEAADGVLDAADAFFKK